MANIWQNTSQSWKRNLSEWEKDRLEWEKESVGMRKGSAGMEKESAGKTISNFMHVEVEAGEMFLHLLVKGDAGSEFP